MFCIDLSLYVVFQYLGVLFCRSVLSPIFSICVCMCAPYARATCRTQNKRLIDVLLHILRLFYG